MPGTPTSSESRSTARPAVDPGVHNASQPTPVRQHAQPNRPGPYNQAGDHTITAADPRPRRATNRPQRQPRHALASAFRAG
jgi:hypothetical protein